MTPENNDKITKLREMSPLLSNISLAAGSIIGLYAFIMTFLSYSSLPPGVCPIDLNRSWMYTAIVLLGLSFILSFFEPKKTKK